MQPRAARCGTVCDRCGIVAYGGEIFVGGRRGLECAECAGDDVAWNNAAPGSGMVGGIKEGALFTQAMVPDVPVESVKLFIKRRPKWRAKL